MHELVREYYERKLAEHGATPRGVDWNSEESQQRRFTELLKIREGTGESVNDYGCGYGALANRLIHEGFAGSYSGYDISPEMVRVAARRLEGAGSFRFTSEASLLGTADVTVASGLFNVRVRAGDDAWVVYIRRTLDDIAAVSRHGFAFNLLTRHADRDRMRSDLYYGDPAEWLTYCLERFSRRVALLHDYGMFEFTVLVRAPFAPLARTGA